MQKGYLPAIIRQENRHLYQQCLNHAENGDILPLTRLLIGQLAGTLREILGDWDRLSENKSG
ncbi:hypothetical protein [Conchiformibius steedae]|uniref:hypothetical protein n=1 Tax=Conchiformibius steedae TaxID=153493 RepID=UPI00047E69D8|nr:hypothetical protein [Conchiformibius steedae]QMT32622.1 hypothetical protein H3L98_00210 [Conchiformibius steedae]